MPKIQPLWGNIFCHRDLLCPRFPVVQIIVPVHFGHPLGEINGADPCPVEQVEKDLCGFLCRASKDCPPVPAVLQIGQRPVTHPAQHPLYFFLGLHPKFLLWCLKCKEKPSGDCFILSQVNEQLPAVLHHGSALFIRLTCDIFIQTL